MAKNDERESRAQRPEHVIATQRETAGVTTFVEWLESLAARARRSWMDRRARVPLQPRR